MIRSVKSLCLPGNIFNSSVDVLRFSDCVSAFLLIDINSFCYRRWVVVDKDYKYVQSYDKPVFAQVTPHFDENNTLCLDAPGMDTLRVSMKLDRDENCIEDLKYGYYCT